MERSEYAADMFLSKFQRSTPVLFIMGVPPGDPLLMSSETTVLYASTFLKSTVHPKFVKQL